MLSQVIIFSLVFVVAFFLKNIMDLQSQNNLLELKLQQKTQNNNRIANNVEGRDIAMTKPPRSIVEEYIYRIPMDSPKKIGYLTPNVDGNINYDFEEVLELYKAKLDRSGYRFIYFTNVNGSRIYIIDSKGKICDDEDYGCNEIYTDDLVTVINREYIVNLY